MKKNQIITVGICPCWDITCYVDGVEWGDHKKITSQTFVPAGKALNISRALAWMGVEREVELSKYLIYSEIKGGAGAAAIMRSAYESR